MAQSPETDFFGGPYRVHKVNRKKRNHHSGDIIDARRQALRSEIPDTGFDHIEPKIPRFVRLTHRQRSELSPMEEWNREQRIQLLHELGEQMLQMKVQSCGRS